MPVPMPRCSIVTPRGWLSPRSPPISKPKSLWIRWDPVSRVEEGWTRGYLFGMACPDQLSSRQYAVWLVLWVGWNAFIICFYLEVGRLSQVMSPPASSSSLHPPSLPPSILLLFIPPSSFPLCLPILPAVLPPPSPAPQLCPSKGTQSLWVLPPWQQSTHAGGGLQHGAPMCAWDGQTDGSGQGGWGGGFEAGVQN